MVRALAVLAKDLGLVPNNQQWLTAIVTPVPEDPAPSSGLDGTVHM